MNNLELVSVAIGFGLVGLYAAGTVEADLVLVVGLAVLASVAGVDQAPLGGILGLPGSDGADSGNENGDPDTDDGADAGWAPGDSHSRTGFP